MHAAIAEAVAIAAGSSLALLISAIPVEIVMVPSRLKLPHRLKQSPPGGAIPEPVSFTDCSFILQCFPCTACSPRKALRGCCPDTGSLRRLVDCELIRPRPRASGVDLVCCVAVHRENDDVEISPGIDCVDDVCHEYGRYHAQIFLHAMENAV
ncbi:hypothetical protein RB195_012233 [Necator americanus]|uniref:Uncharacterized protein n=1 Tax=Necator americanus TaxID=51031 RepID=A0ABR1D659_NECAM